MRIRKKIDDKSRDVHRINFLTRYSESASKKTPTYKFPAILNQIWETSLFLSNFRHKNFRKKWSFSNVTQNGWKFVGRGLFRCWFWILNQKIDLMYVTWLIVDFLPNSYRDDFWVDPYTLRSSFAPQKFVLYKCIQTRRFRKNYQKIFRGCTSGRKFQIFENFFRKISINSIFRPHGFKKLFFSS